MKDRVFLVWSGNRGVALKVKKILENDYNYMCMVGGNSDNASRFSTVGDTVIQQLKSCNQAIIIFQNNDNGELSDNLFFELGYALASYGQKKVHCVKLKEDEIVMPSDFDNGFVEPMICDGTEDDFSKKIVEYFISRQKMSINDNKILIMNNRYTISEKIEQHYSESGSRCSDYELAQYILYYMQASMMFDDTKKAYDEIVEFKRRHWFDFSSELRLAVGICLSFFELLFNIIENDKTNDVYIEEKAFFRFKNNYEYLLGEIVRDDLGIFDEWAEVFINEQLTFGYMLFGNNCNISDERRREVYKTCIEYGNTSLKCVENLEKITPCRENHDDKGILALLRAYLYRNIYISKKFLGEEDAIDWLRESAKYRALLRNTYGNGSIDSHLYNNFCMEYYLAIVNWLEDTSDGVSDFEITMYKEEMREYLGNIKLSNNETAYLHKIKMWSEA